MAMSSPNQPDLSEPPHQPTNQGLEQPRHTPDDDTLGCGRLIDDVWDRIDQPADRHERGCPFCTDARRKLTTLSSATHDMVIEEETEPAYQPRSDLLESVMTIVRAEVRRGRRLPMEAAVNNDPAINAQAMSERSGLMISEQALTALVWSAADTVPGVHARHCTITVVPSPAPPTSDGKSVLADMGAPITNLKQRNAPANLQIVLTVATTAAAALPTLSRRLRNRIIDRVSTETGLGVVQVDLQVEDLYDA